MNEEKFVVPCRQQRPSQYQPCCLWLGGSVSRCGGELGEQAARLETRRGATRSLPGLVSIPWYWAREPAQQAVFHPADAS